MTDSSAVSPSVRRTSVRLLNSSLSCSSGLSATKKVYTEKSSKILVAALEDWDQVSGFRRKFDPSHSVPKVTWSQFSRNTSCSLFLSRYGAKVRRRLGEG